jgi:thymidylate kinase
MNRPSKRKSLLVSFSGLDGAGKSTQIANLQSVIAGLGLRSQTLAFWDDVVVLSGMREGFVHKVYKSERGVGAPDKPVARRDKNVRAWYLSLIRHGLYLLDALHLRWVVWQHSNRNADVLILDRYIYDELANLPLERLASRAFVRLMTHIVPQPDIAYLLDADPEAARARKPEYPVEFMRKSRRAYFELSRLLGLMTVIPPLPLSDAKREVERPLLRALNQRESERETVNLDTAPAA